MLITHGARFLGMGQSELLGLIAKGIPPRRAKSSNTRDNMRSHYASMTVKELRDECRRNRLPVSLTKQLLIQNLVEKLGMRESPIVISSSESDADTSKEIVTLSDSDGASKSTGRKVPPSHRARNRSSSSRSSSMSRSSVESLASTINNLSIHDGYTTDVDHTAATYPASEMIRSGKWDRIPRDIRIYTTQPSIIDSRLIHALQGSCLYRSVLLYQPVRVDDFCSLFPSAKMTSGSVAGDRRIMRTWLDTQGICYID